MAFNMNFSFGQNATSPHNLNPTQSWFTSLMKGSNFNKGFLNDAEKLEVILNNPATIKILSYSADIATMARINKVGLDGKVIEADVFKNIENPNPWQTWNQLIYDADFWLNMGNAYIYEERGTIYVLNPNGIELTNKQKEMFEVLTFSKYGATSKRNALKGTFKYKHNTTNNKEQTLELKNLHILSDLSNSVTGTWLKSNSRIDALYRVIMNSQSGLMSKEINLEFTQKFLLSGQTDGSDTSYQGIGMSTEETDSIDKSLRGPKQIHTTPKKLNVDHMVADLNKLKLDDAFISDFTVIGNIYGMTKDILDIALKGSTYENKEKSFGAYIDYTKMPHVTQIVDLFGELRGMDNLQPSYEHLPFNQVFKAEKDASNLVALQGLKIAQELGLDISEQLKQIYL